MHDDHLAEILGRHGSARLHETSDREIDAEMLPAAGEQYQAHARGANKPVFTLHCILGKDGFRSFQNSHLDSDSHFVVEGKEQVISLRFCNFKVTAVTIRGRNLGKLYDYLHQHRMPWIQRVDAGRDFAEDGEPVITAIEIKEVEDPKPSK